VGEPIPPSTPRSVESNIMESKMMESKIAPAHEMMVQEPMVHETFVQETMAAEVVSTSAPDFEHELPEQPATRVWEAVPPPRPAPSLEDFADSDEQDELDVPAYLRKKGSDY